MARIKIFKVVTRKAAIPDFNVPELYAVTTPEFRELYGKAGVYILYSGENEKKPLYIGRSKSDAGRTIARHFQKWSAKELKFVERRPESLDKLYVEFEEMDKGRPQDIIDKETELIEKYKPFLNLRKNVLKQKNPDFYAVTEEKRALLDARVKQYEQEQEARDNYEKALYELEMAEAQRQAAEEAAMEADKMAREAETAAQERAAEAAKEQAEKDAQAAQKAEQQAEKKVERSKAFFKNAKRISFNPKRR